jgi:hypothetical protein
MTLRCWLNSQMPYRQLQSLPVNGALRDETQESPLHENVLDEIVRYGAFMGDS